ncbi:MAG: hypothetical protein AAF349_14595 [Cyanobacteria bacterium P01_A01_bin.68]
MKTNTLGLAAFFCTYATFASLILGATGTAKAQEAIPLPDQTVLNGLYSPTASERFFEEGKRSIEREARILINPKLNQREGLLKNNIINSKIIEELEDKNPILDFPQDNFQRKLEPKID